MDKSQIITLQCPLQQREQFCKLSNSIKIHFNLNKFQRNKWVMSIHFKFCLLSRNNFFYTLYEILQTLYTCTYDLKY